MLPREFMPRVICPYASALAAGLRSWPVRSSALGFFRLRPPDVKIFFVCGSGDKYFSLPRGAVQGGAYVLHLFPIQTTKRNQDSFFRIELCKVIQDHGDDQVVLAFSAVRNRGNQAAAEIGRHHRRLAVSLVSVA